MKLCRFRVGDDPTPRSGILHEGRLLETDGQQPIGTHKPEDVSLLAPIPQPPSYRAFDAFEDHAARVRRRLGREGVPEEWHDAPVFSFGSTASIIGPEAPVTKPPYTDELDFELEVGIIIGRTGSDIPPAEADDFILGFTILNDWTARDLERQEGPLGHGAVKAKDFATSLGPCLVTPDSLEDRIVDQARGNRYDLKMEALLNGETVCEGNLRDMRWTFAEMIAHASRGVQLKEGDLIGSGAVGGGCLLEQDSGFLQPGDEVTLKVERLGELTNRIV
ncbi:MAG: fumarylacetoacetate hydrolase family protein [Armatimonadetes bacterium]|nr:fumarylacetoacetate hydrolase family protein [Armatimonadota bacterium]